VSDLLLTVIIGVKLMSNAILDDFITLLKEKPAAIYDHHDLYLQVAGWSDDLDELANRVADYCTAHPGLYEILRSLGKTDLAQSDRLPGKGTQAPAPQPEDYKHTILNTMHQVYGTPAPEQKPQQ
jgi:hypothetical protein